jgi:hypothetical protein
MGVAMNLAAFRAALRALIGAAVDSGTWTDALVDEALRNGLRVYGDRGPIWETTFVVASGGLEQDLSGVTHLYAVTGLAWPWYDGADFEGKAVRWRPMGQKRVYLLSRAAPAVGDEMRVRYRKLYFIQNLDGGGATTVPADHERIVLLAGGVWLLGMRLRQIAENPAVPKEAVGTLGALRDRWQSELDDRLAEAAGITPNPVWGQMGL